MASRSKLVRTLRLVGRYQPVRDRVSELRRHHRKRQGEQPHEATPRHAAEMVRLGVGSPSDRPSCHPIHRRAGELAARATTLPLARCSGVGAW